MITFSSIMKPIDSFVGLCIQKEYVSQDEAPWLRYALERRIASLTAFGVLLIIGLFITTPATLFAFLITFCSLRSRTNGFHAKSVGGCLFYSILGEIFYLRVLPNIWNAIFAFITLAVSIILIWFFAPYNHPNMDLSPEEVTACAKSAKWRLVMLIFVLNILYAWKQYQLALGILMGIVMTALTLAMAYGLQIIIPEERGRI